MIDDLQDLLALPFVTQVTNSIILVNYGGDPAAASAALAEADAAGLLDGLTILIGGLQLPSLSEVLAFDSTIDTLTSALDPICPDRIGSAVTSDGTTIPHLTCDDETGLVTTASPVGGALEASLASAIQQVLSARLPDVSGLNPVVTVQGGHANVDLPAGFVVAASQLLEADAYALDRDLNLTARSNGLVTGVTFTVGGDCLTYALAVGGDTCATDGGE